MAQQMLKYTREQPDIWKNILARREEITRNFVSSQDGSLKRLVLIGSGSSFTASRTAAEILMRLTKVEVTVAEPTRLYPLLTHLGEGTVFCACSQSGRSTSTLEAVRAIQKAGFRVTAVTANPDSSLAKACDGHVTVECGEELVGPKTKGMTSSALTLTLMGAELALAKELLDASAYNKAIIDFSRSFDLAAGNIERCVSWCGEHPEIAEAPHMIVVADGMALPAALEGALKVLETLYVPVFAYEFEEYLHGVNNTLNPQSWMIHLVPEGENRRRFLALSDFAQERGGHNFIISSGTPTGRAGELNLAASGNELTLPFEMLLPFHAISALISEIKGINCDKPQFKDFAQRLHTKA